jgi:hypothetical protein
VITECQQRRGGSYSLFFHADSDPRVFSVSKVAERPVNKSTYAYLVFDQMTVFPKVMQNAGKYCFHIKHWDLCTSATTSEIFLSATPRSAPRDRPCR